MAISSHEAQYFLNQPSLSLVTETPFREHTRLQPYNTIFHEKVVFFYPYPLTSFGSLFADFLDVPAKWKFRP